MALFSLVIFFFSGPNVFHLPKIEKSAHIHLDLSVKQTLRRDDLKSEEIEQ